MPGAKLPAVRLPAAVGQEDDGSLDSARVVDLPPSNKFGFAWPVESTVPVHPAPSSERGVSLSSSEGESDASDSAGITSGVQSQAERTDENDSAPMSRLGKQGLADHLHIPPAVPRLSRAISMPLPSRLEHLQNPRRPPSRSSVTTSSPISEIAPEISQFHDLSLELADSVQMIIQTLLQISPSQVLDPAKEQFSACSLSVPTPCMSAVFTSMKNLNYMAANMAALCTDADPVNGSGHEPPFLPSTTPGSLSTMPDDFDIGELLQGVGDALSGVAAHAGVDLVLYHGDVGMKHVSMKGDECGLSYVLSHVVRQILSTAQRGDSIEIGLFISTTPFKPQNLPTDLDAMPSSNGDTSPATDMEGPLWCLFDIAHNFASGDGKDSAVQPSTRHLPSLDSQIVRRLLRQVGASLEYDLPPRSLIAGRTCEMTVKLERGDLSIVNARTASPPEDVSYQLLSGVRVADEPTLEELAQFTETLRGKKVKLYANSRGAFAHHLTSYLTSWGLDVSHVSADAGAENTLGPGDDSAAGTPSGAGQRTIGGSPLRSTLGLGLQGFAQAIPQQSPLPLPTADSRQAASAALSFIFIDDDVAVLRERLRKLRINQSYPLTLRKRPALAPHHRPKSTPHVPRAGGTGIGLPVVIVHFTSLTNYKLVKDVIQSDLQMHQGSTSGIPEVMIIPKPAGPRRFLTALHTAVTKPIVDPFFMPIATSPITTGQSSFFNFNNPDTRTPSPKSPSTSAIPTHSHRTSSDRSTRSPKETPGDPVNIPPPSPLSMSDSMEYFSEAAAKLGASPSSGLVIQSPSGQPAGIFFHPKGRGSKGSSGLVMERDRGQLLIPSERVKASSRRNSNNEGTGSPHSGSPHSPVTFSSLHAASKPPPPVHTESHESPPGAVKSKSAKPGSPRGDENPMPSSPRRSATSMNIMQKLATPPQTSPTFENGGATSPMARRPTRRATDTKQSPQTASKDGGIVVPPISVLIVDDNPINQTILSTFMKKKKIKYDVAKNGEEAVQKWRTGGFHLILMDIQMPVMDGIEATKEIRKVERINSSSFPLSTPRSEEQRTPLKTPPLRTPSEAPSTSTGAGSPYRSSVIIVALTASSLQSDRVAALAAGCNDFLTKPVSLQWLNNKIIEWGSIKALQMWADLRPEVEKSISTGQAAQAHNVARRLHVPEGRTTPSGSPSRSSSVPRTQVPEAPRVVDVATSMLSNTGHATLPALPTNDASGDSYSVEQSSSIGSILSTPANELPPRTNNTVAKSILSSVTPVLGAVDAPPNIVSTPQPLEDLPRPVQELVHPVEEPSTEHDVPAAPPETI